MVSATSVKRDNKRLGFEGAASLARLCGECLVSLRAPSDRGQGRDLRTTAGIAGSLADQLNLGLGYRQDLEPVKPLARRSANQRSSYSATVTALARTTFANC
jgi:hypothetical protein